MASALPELFSLAPLHNLPRLDHEGDNNEGS